MTPNEEYWKSRALEAEARILQPEVIRIPYNRPIASTILSIFGLICIALFFVAILGAVFWRVFANLSL